MKKRLLSMLLVTLLIVNLFPVMSIPVSATAPNSDAEIEARINELSDSLLSIMGQAAERKALDTDA